VFTDDKAARSLAQSLQLPVSGTLGILVSLVRQGNLKLQQANHYLDQMISQGYYAPVTKLEQLI